MKKVLKKWKGGAEKHGGLDKAMVAQVNAWTENPEEKEKAAKKTAEEAAAREATAKRLAEETALRERQELEQKYAEDMAVREATAKREAEELAAKEIEALQKKHAEEMAIAQKQLEEAAARETELKRQAEEGAVKETAAKQEDESSKLIGNTSLKTQMEKFFRENPEVKDELAVKALDIIKNYTNGDTQGLKQALSDLNDPTIDLLLQDSEVQVSGETAPGGPEVH